MNFGGNRIRDEPRKNWQMTHPPPNINFHKVCVGSVLTSFMSRSQV